MIDFFENTGLESGDILHLTPRQVLEYCHQGAMLVDVREAYMNRFKMFDVPEVIYCPYSILEKSYQDLPPDRPLIFADAAGLQSREAVKFLQEKGMGQRVANLAGGLVEWERDGLPLIIDKNERLSGSCMCQLKPREK